MSNNDYIRDENDIEDFEDFKEFYGFDDEDEEPEELDFGETRVIKIDKQINNDEID